MKQRCEVTDIIFESLKAIFHHQRQQVRKMLSSLERRKKLLLPFFFLLFKPKKGKAESVLQIPTQALMVKFSLIWFFTYIWKEPWTILRFLWFSLLFLWKKFYISFRESLHRLPCFSDCLRRQLCKNLKLIYQPIPSPAFALPWSRMKYCADSVCEWLNF